MFLKLTRWLCLTALAISISTITSSAQTPMPQYAVAEAGWQWPASSDGITYIPVCWENPQGYGSEVYWVKTKIQNTWQAAANVNFYYWGQCSTNMKGIHILVADTRSNSQVGRRLDGRKNGMELNFTFKNFSPSCQAANKRESCIESIAVHEFGHALGFIHEQDRADSTCKVEVGKGPGWLLTDYDAESVMNYCNPRWNNEGKLSPKDVKGVQTLYGARTVAARGRVLINDHLNQRAGQQWENIIVDFTNAAGKGSRQYFNVNQNSTSQARIWNFTLSGKYCFKAWSYTMYSDNKERRGYGTGCFTLSGGKSYTFTINFVPPTYNNVDFNIALVSTPRR